MFTPPPSPLPARQSAPSLQEPEPLFLEDESKQSTKKIIGRRFRMAVILIPLLVICITARIGYVSSRAVEPQPDLVLPLSWHGIKEDSSWRHHKRQPEPEPQTVSGGLSLSSAPPTSTTAAASPTPSSSSIPVSLQPIPTVPSAPPTLPTPFPQTFDAGIAQNFSSISCSNFFANMTNSAPYRSCRPFSILLENSAAFINAQSNLTLMNSIIWGTCNTTLGLSQCEANMDWFTDALKTACTDELKDNNAMTVATLKALQAFSIMYDVACQVDPTSNTYCYLNAVSNSNPVDSYYYALPLGIPVPSSAVPTCSTCSKSVMGVYSAALQNSTEASQLSGLQETYEATAKLTVAYCGANFATTGLGSSAITSFRRPSWTVMGSLAIFASLLLRSAL